MDDAKRKIILDNIEDLIKNTDFLELLRMCKEKQILNDPMIAKIQNLNEDTIKKHEALFEKITHRRPTDFNKLLEICQELNYHTALQLLNPVSQNEGAIHSKKVPRQMLSTNDNRSIELKPFVDEVQHKLTVTINKANQFRYHDKLETYKMNSKNRGVLFLVNIIDFKSLDLDRRNGAENDSGYLIKLFRAFGFKIYFYTNLETQQFNQLVDKLTRSEELAETDCLVFALLTHGNEGNSASFSDDGLIHVETILHKFNNVNCPFLRGKPKMFLFPFCRGNSPDKGVHLAFPKKTEHDSVGKMPPPEICTDMLICYGTVPGYQTHREPENGSWYIKEFCQVFAKYAHNMHVEDMLKIVHTNVMRYRTTDNLQHTLQTPSNVNREFNKILFLNPGYNE